jgi:hypothetical protein
MFGWLRGERRGRRRQIVGVILGFTLALSAGAIAAWITNATGPGKAEFGTITSPTIVAGTTPQGAKCFPGGLCDASVKITNPNGALVVTEIQAAPSLTGTCTEALMVNPHALATPVAVPAGTTDNLHIPNAFAVSSAAPTECQGVSVSQNLKLIFSTP